MKFKKIETNIKDLFVIEPQIFEDSRGFFLESYNYNDFKEIGIDNIFVQENHSKSLKGVLRGLHFQKGEYSQAKLIRALKGVVLDIAVDLRKDSETFGKYIAVELNEKNKKMLFIPKGFAHGFLSLENDTETFYKCDNFYNPKSESGIIWNDRDLNIDWNFEKYNIDENELIISEKDKKNISFKEYKKINSIE
ncbi:dTDP-4-dehydrorhamnose 3,5-epimerase [Fusobacterium nucleatum]|uniref:dTDP-4-dehydrorhamnose 3,5-epimerase n=1 Tax=Fusobacterium nucleatum subsp. polymorphum TaxID=76857 RepID=UPI0021C35275|nr:dTDP-4-dehydrorhamnose 3,5-epimerase [Fusobacterium polymorphum]